VMIRREAPENFIPQAIGKQLVPSITIAAEAFFVPARSLRECPERLCRVPSTRALLC
jgi:hypothetical protein